MSAHLLKRPKVVLISLLLLGTVGNGTLLGVLDYKWRKSWQKAMARVSARQGAFTDVPATTNMALRLPADGKVTFDKVTAATRSRLRSELDVRPEDWHPGKRGFKEPATPLPFTPDDIPAPSNADVVRWTKETPVLRRMPYPYYRSLSIPWDPDNSRFLDIYYSQALLSRKYGLDFPSAFWPYSSSPLPAFAVFDGLSSEPRIQPVFFEEGPATAVDTWPLFLSYYYRGWTDHIHGWTSECCYPHSILPATTRTIPASGKLKLTLPVQIEGDKHHWRGFEIQLAIANEVSAFEIELVEPSKLPHFIVYNKALNDRPGWDISGLDRKQLSCFYLQLSQEVNRPWTTKLGLECQDNAILIGVTVTVEGKRGAHFGLTSLKLVDPDRASVAQQMAVMKKYNILPAVVTAHGGYSGWTMLNFRDVDNYPITLAGKTSYRKALGSTPGTPAYISDLLLDFGAIFLNRIDTNTRCADKYVQVDELPDGRRYYDILRGYSYKTYPQVPAASNNAEFTENAGPHVCRGLLENTNYAQMDCLYTHNNIFSRVVCDGPEPSLPFLPYVYMRSLKTFPSYTARTFEMLCCCKYNLDSSRAFHQRIWCCPVTVASRYALGLRNLEGQVEVKGNDVHIGRIQDRVTGREFPDLAFLSQDLHGQTFYVKDSRTARVCCAGSAVTSLTRNPADFTGRESVTVVDTSTPTRVLDEVDLFERNGRVLQQDVLCFFQTKQAYHGRYALELQSMGKAEGLVTWKPFVLNSHETDYFRFAYKKTNPKVKVFIGWSDEDELKYAATDGSLKGLQGWVIPDYQDTDWHEVVLDFSEMKAGQVGKTVPRCDISTFYFGIQGGEEGDAVFYDGVEFLGARGVRPHSGSGFVLGGRITPHKDGKTVYLRNEQGPTQQTVTTRGGWYIFTGLAPDSVVEVTYIEGGVTYYPARGRVTEVCKNDLDLHIYALDARSNSIPWIASNQKGNGIDTMRSRPSTPEHRDQYNAMYMPHSIITYGGPHGNNLEFLIEDQTNNYGFFDRDRRVENPDATLRIYLSGDCLLENLQSVRSHHQNLFLESFLRRRTGLNVEVIAAATPNASPGSNEASYDKYGRHFDPHLVLHMVLYPSLIQMEPNLQEIRWGWVRDHSPYQMFDFDEQGKLINFPHDTAYGAYMVKADPKVMLQNMPLLSSYFYVGPLYHLTEKSFQLLKAVLAEKYQPDVRKRGSLIYVVTGHYPHDLPPYGRRWNELAFARERFANKLRESCAEVGVPTLDLGPLLEKDGAPLNSWIWENDGHYTPFGNYHIARNLAELLLAQPDFQSLVAQLKRQQEATRGRKASP